MQLSLRTTKVDAHDDSLWSAAWTEGPDLLVTGSVDESVKSWRASEDVLEETHQFTGHSLGVVSVAVDPSGSAASSALDSLIRVWDINTGSTRSVIECPPAEVWSIIFSPGETASHIASAGGASNGINIYSLESSERVSSMSLPSPVQGAKEKATQFVLSIAYSRDGSRLAAGAMDGTVALFDVGTGRLLHTFEGHKMPVRSVAFSPDGRQLYTACDDMHVHVYEVEHSAVLHAFAGHSSWVLAAAPSPDGTGLVTGSSDRTIKVWDLAKRQCVQTHSQHSDCVWGLAFRPDGSRLASVSDDKSICIFDVV